MQITPYCPFLVRPVEEEEPTMSRYQGEIDASDLAYVPEISEADFHAALEAVGEIAKQYGLATMATLGSPIQVGSVIYLPPWFAVTRRGGEELCFGLDASLQDQGFDEVHERVEVTVSTLTRMAEWFEEMAAEIRRGVPGVPLAAMRLVRLGRDVRGESGG